MEKKAYNTCCSQTVTHPSTEPARHCLTSVIRREQVYSMWYGSYLVEKCQLHKLAVTVTAVKVGVPMQAWKLVGNVHMCPSQCPSMYTPPVYKEWPSSSSSVQGVAKLVHMLCTNWALAWAHVYICNQFPSLGTPLLQQCVLQYFN